ncbi:MAG: bifunctional nicotinamidase/pyrazinamidase [Treponema sp.]|nr:bifunctional nicotinamidase/pyrazinamidase [Treponema sp.]
MASLTVDPALSALIIIDVQNDFCPGGALAVEGGDEVIEPLNRLSARLSASGGKVIATQDWHPGGHVSFASSHPGKNPGETIDLQDLKGQVLWPDHCVQGSKGAQFHQNLDLDSSCLILRKGFRPGLDSYSAFLENDRCTQTGLHGFLQELGVTTLLMGGLATDYCVYYSALDALGLQYRVIILEDAVRGVGQPEGSIERALGSLKEAGALLCPSSGIL